MIAIKYLVLNFIYAKRLTFANLFFTLLFSWLPVKNGKFLICNYLGSGYGCNPKYIADEIIKQNVANEIVWFVKPEFNKKEEFPNCIKLVNYYDTFRTLYELSTSEFWIDNSRKNYFIKKGLKKKKGQIYINTWHGSLGIKKMDADVPLYNDNIVWKKITQQDSDMIDIMVSNSDFETNIYRNSMWYKNKILEIGHPRNDIFFIDDKKIKDKIYSYYKIPKNKKIALYAPSFRDDLRTDYYSLNYEKLKKCLEETTNEKWVILSKFHPKILYKLNRLINNNIEQHDVSLYPDIQELLAAADILISDYSSCMFDYLLSRKPCFVFATDIERYNNERGLYFKLETTPFPVAVTHEELYHNIRNFDYNLYKLNVDKFMSYRKVYESGNASKKLVEVIKNIKQGD